MTDTKRDFLYEFNRGLRATYSNSPSILSIFESIENGNLQLKPVEIPEVEFITAVGKCISVIKRIVMEPYKILERKQALLPVSQAQNMDHDSVKLTLEDPSLWTKIDGTLLPKYAYSLTSEDVFLNYENAFIYHLIGLTVNRLKSIKKSYMAIFGINSDDEIDRVDALPEYKECFVTVTSHIKKLTRLSCEKVFSENKNRVVDFSNIYLTDTINTDKRYNYCYKFFCTMLKGHSQKISVNRDFRVLYHNFALVHLMYNLHKSGYVVENVNYYISQSGKMFIDKVRFVGEKCIELHRSDNGVEILSGEKNIRVEFSKSAFRTINDIHAHYESVAKKHDEKYSDVFVAYLTFEEEVSAGVLSVGYKNVEKAILKLIQSL